jgi:hypothetical protein
MPQAAGSWRFFDEYGETAYSTRKLTWRESGGRNHEVYLFIATAKDLADGLAE